MAVSEIKSIPLVESAASDLFERLGYRPVVGRVWAVLILSPYALDARTIQQVLNISSGALSMALKELVDLELTYRDTIENNRHFVYRAETDLWLIVNRMFHKRERKKLKAILLKLKQAEALQKGSPYANDSSDITAYQFDQIRRLVSLGEFIIDVLDALMERTKVELKAAQKWLAVSGRLGGEPLSRIRRAINAKRVGKRKQ
ncbi:MAG: hypothetical protein QNJ97_23090 [Myxococcota bacterium]|nr:hypothetical protein [Myxococcota bacterium]